MAKMPRKVYPEPAGDLAAKSMGARVSSGRAKVAPAARRKKSLRANLRVMVHPPAWETAYTAGKSAISVIISIREARRALRYNGLAPTQQAQCSETLPPTQAHAGGRPLDPRALP